MRFFGFEASCFVLCIYLGLYLVPITLSQQDIRSNLNLVTKPCLRLLSLWSLLLYLPTPSQNQPSDKQHQIKPIQNHVIINIVTTHLNHRIILHLHNLHKRIPNSLPQANSRPFHLSLWRCPRLLRPPLAPHRHTAALELPVRPPLDHQARLRHQQ